MKTYSEEYSELVEWCKESLAKAEATIAKLPKMGGYDDRGLYIENEVWQEWNKRRLLLRIKYKKELTDEEIEDVKSLRELNA